MGDISISTLAEAIELYAEARARRVDATWRKWGVEEAERDVAETRARLDAVIASLT